MEVKRCCTGEIAVLIACVSVSLLASAAFASSMNGRAGVMPAFYDGQRFLINFKELSPDAENAVIAHNGSINVIYMSDPGLPGGQSFVSVLDAIQERASTLCGSRCRSPSTQGSPHASSRGTMTSSTPLRAARSP